MGETITTIETSVYGRLDWMIRHIAQTAGLGIARGAVGIGKTYCMTQISRCLKEEGANVIMTTRSPATEGNAPAFVRQGLSNVQRPSKNWCPETRLGFRLNLQSH